MALCVRCSSDIPVSSVFALPDLGSDSARHAAFETSGGPWLERVHLGREDEVALGEAVYLVRPYRNLRVPPPEGHVRVVPLLLGQLPDPVDEKQRLPEVLEPEPAPEVVLLDHLPFGHLRREKEELFALEGRRIAPARHARFGC